jgi:metal-responsive CopG/Arc/MetJ family transcriptional regulator
MTQANLRPLEKTVNVRLPNDLVGAMDRIASRKFLKRSDIVREALRDYRDKHLAPKKSEVVL